MRTGKLFCRRKWADHADEMTLHAQLGSGPWTGNPLVGGVEEISAGVSPAQRHRAADSNEPSYDSGEFDN
jgi:hypothetical protein